MAANGKTMAVARCRYRFNGHTMHRGDNAVRRIVFPFAARDRSYKGPARNVGSHRP
jgi:hypothetical protein